MIGLVKWVRELATSGGAGAVNDNAFPLRKESKWSKTNKQTNTVLTRKHKGLKQGDVHVKKDDLRRSKPSQSGYETTFGTEVAHCAYTSFEREWTHEVTNEVLGMET